MKYYWFGLNRKVYLFLWYKLDIKYIVKIVRKNFINVVKVIEKNSGVWIEE